MRGSSSHRRQPYLPETVLLEHFLSSAAVVPDSYLLTHNSSCTPAVADFFTRRLFPCCIMNNSISVQCSFPEFAPRRPFTSSHHFQFANWALSKRRPGRSSCLRSRLPLRSSPSRSSKKFRSALNLKLRPTRRLLQQHSSASIAQRKGCRLLARQKRSPS